MAGINGVGRVGLRSYVAPVSLSTIITNGLVMNLDAGNALSYSGTGTTWTDLSGNGNSGTLVNGTSYSSTSGGALAFDGINDYVSLNSNSINSLTRFTFNIWFKTPSIAKEQVLFSTVNSTQTMGYHIEFYNSKILMQLFPNGGYTYASSVLSSNTWYNITVSYDNGNIAYYNNGIQDGSATRTFNVSTATTFIGKWGGGAFYDLVFGGNIAHVSFYDRVLTSAEVLQNFNSTKSRFGFTSYTTRTAAFATATGITDATILNALNTFDTGLISNGLDTKMKALYPFVGGTANTHKFNFMDARDVDAAFRLQFNGGWVHNATGAKPNGINGYANTYLSPYTQLTLGSRHLSMYASDNSQANQYSIDMGAYDSAGQKSNHLSIRRTADNVVGQLNNWGNQSLTSTNNTTGLLIVNRPSISSSKAFKNNVLIASTTNDITGQVMPNFNIFLGNSNENGTAGGSVMSSRGFSLSSIGYGLSDSEASTFYTLVQALQTSLSRAV